MNKTEVVDRIKSGQIWFFKDSDAPTVWGVGEILLPFQIEWEDGVNSAV